MEDRVFDREFKERIRKNQAKVPVIVLDRIDKTLDLLPEKETISIDNRTRKGGFMSKRLKHTIVAASVAMAVLIVSTTVSPVMAKTITNLPVIGSVFRLLGDMGLKFASEKGISSIVGQSKRDKDIKVTVNDILYDGVRLSIGYSMEGKGIGELERPEVLVDNKSINFSMSNSGSLISENSYAGIINIDPTSELPKNFKLSIILNKIGSKEGSWNFEHIFVKSQDALLNTKIVTPMITQKLEKGSITIEKVLVSKSIVKINTIETNLPRGSFYQYQLIDNYGNVLKPISGSGYGDNGTQKTDFTFESLNNNPQYFTIKALDTQNRINNKLVDIKVEFKEELPIKISQGEGGEITVNKIEYLGNKTLVYYTYKGNDPYGNGTCLWLEDEFGSKLNNPTKSVERNADGTYVLECVPLDKNKTIKVATRKLNDTKIDLEFKIDLK